MAAFITFRMATPAVAARQERVRHHERADVRISAHDTTAQTIAHRDRLNGRGYVARAYQVAGVSADDARTVVARNGMRVRIK